MILTEEEAKTKWCPEGRMLVNAPGYGAGNRFADDPHPNFIAETRCIGSACMAWRWRIEGGMMESYPSGGQATARYVPGSGVPSTTHGYCGKAGKP